jgi:predicted CXXCH cytochrome family protein
MRRVRCITTWLARAALLWSLSPGVVHPGDWHRERGLRCSDCHTMHNSRGNVPMRYDDEPAPAERLLRAESATAVCLACHGRPVANAPNVLMPSNADPPGGGFPQDLSDPARVAHALGTEAVVPPEGDTAVVMRCVTCHDPHGSGGYRNLRANPSGVAGRTAAPPVVAQTVTANGTNPADVYVRANVRYVSGMSAWCLDCHNTIGSDHGVPGSEHAHPWDRPLFGGLDEAGWTAWSGDVQNRIAVENPLGAAAPSQSDQVFCLSCHKAHGSPNAAALVHADGVTLDSTCQQCHDQ